jgi:hypothetical protein
LFIINGLNVNEMQRSTGHFQAGFKEMFYLNALYGRLLLKIDSREILFFIRKSIVKTGKTI